MSQLFLQSIISHVVIVGGDGELRFLMLLNKVLSALLLSIIVKLRHYLAERDGTRWLLLHQGGDGCSRMG